MFTEHVQEIINIGEELSNVEFKTSTADLQGACETVCGFLNNKGGKVFIGIKNNGVKIGQMVTDRTRQEISNRIKKIEPPADIDISYIPLYR
jgi:ATP-dependent DNA helicase RecG